jgi:hypothetical protein
MKDSTKGGKINNINSLEKLFVKRKNMARCRQNNFDSDESYDSNDDDEQYERKIKKKLKKVNLGTYKKKSVLPKLLFNECHFTKECKLSIKFCQICKVSDHNTYHCPSKTNLKMHDLD